MREVVVRTSVVEHIAFLKLHQTRGVVRHIGVRQHTRRMTSRALTILVVASYN